MTTLRPYRGINIPILWLAGQERGYEVDFWATFDQWKSVGGHVKKGEKATQIVFFKPIRKTVEADAGTERSKSFPLMRTFSVFSIHQDEGRVVEPFLNRTAKQVWESANRAEFDRVVQATQADVRYGGSKALYFRPPADYVQVPHEDYFGSFPAFGETVFHELSHWSEHRLGWEGSYALGELRAELAAVFTMAALNIPDSGDLTNHTAYLGSCLEALENVPRFLFQAAAAASRSADFILSFSRPVEATAEPEMTAA